MLEYLRPALAGLLFIWPCVSVTAEQDFASFSHDEAFTYSQQAIGNSLNGVELLDSQGKPVAIESYRGKPLAISMIYTSCHHVCPSTTQYLNQVIIKARSVLDSDSFQVITVGFDVNYDSPEQMASFRQRTDVNDPYWDFLAADQENIDKLSEQLGFIFFPSPKGFEHLVQTTLVSAEGEIYRQVYGITYPTPHVVEPLKQLVFGEPEEQSTLSYLENRIRLFCTVYDPATDSYRIDISVFIGTGVGMMVSILFAFVLFKEWRKSLRSRP
jgi:protein SCO1/2